MKTVTIHYVVFCTERTYTRKGVKCYRSVDRLPSGKWGYYPIKPTQRNAYNLD